MDSGFPIGQVLGDPLVHTSRYTTFLELVKSEPVFPDPVICLLHVYAHCQCMLFILEAILDLLGNVHHLVLSGMVLPKACLLWSEEVALLQVPFQASIDHSFHEFAHTTGAREADRTVAVCICSVLALLVDEYYVSFSPALRSMPCLPAVVENSQEFGLCFGAKVFQHLICDFVWVRGLLVLQGFQGLFKLLCVEWAVHVFR